MYYIIFCYRTSKTIIQISDSLIKLRGIKLRALMMTTMPFQSIYDPTMIVITKKMISLCRSQFRKVKSVILSEKQRTAQQEVSLSDQTSL